MTMTAYDLTRLTELGELYKQQRAQAEATRQELMSEVKKAEADDVIQAVISRASGVSRERFRQIRIAEEKKAAKEAATKPPKTRRARLAQ